MIQKRTVCICDICGHIENAREVLGQYNETGYSAPEGWSKGKSPTVDICPACAAKLLALKHGNSRVPAVRTVLLNNNGQE